MADERVSLGKHISWERQGRAMEERNARGLTEREFLRQYDPGKYERPSVTADTLIFTVDKGGEDYHLQIMLIQRKDHPCIRKWAVPGGFVGMEESVDQAAVRELEEETGLRDIYLEQLYTWGDVGRDPRTRIISVSYMALVPKEKLVPAAGGDTADVAWYSIGRQEGHFRLWNESRELAEEDLAFDHARMIRLALERMKNKVFYTDIAFRLLPERFTFPELQRLYEAILGEKLHAPNFRRDMQKLVEQTDEKCKSQKAGKPAWYYRQKRN